MGATESQLIKKAADILEVDPARVGGAVVIVLFDDDITPPAIASTAPRPIDLLSALAYCTHAITQRAAMGSAEDWRLIKSDPLG